MCHGLGHGKGHGKDHGMGHGMGHARTRPQHGAHVNTAPRLGR